MHSGVTAIVINTLTVAVWTVDIEDVTPDV